MPDERSVSERVADLDRVEAMIGRLAADDAEAAAARRVLGVEAEAGRLASAFAPDLPPPAPIGMGIDHLTHARDAVARYTAWVASHPDTDSTPLYERERALELAQLDLQRLET